ncbi:MAG TPA: histidine--tRNA ligase [Vicinamibacterales bacterium]|nr:histidine--tRNA ligase [Vicinamibacterales bacterium]
MPQQTRPARGMRDFLPEDVRRRDYVIGVIEGVYRRYGFEPLETPALENIDTLTGKYGEEGNKLIFKVLRRGEHETSGETDLALRYDLTVPLARVVAEHRGQLPKFFKRYQVQPVWRADRPARGRFREFYQCDVDAIGSKSPLVEAEMLSAVSEVLQTLGFSDFSIELNHRELLTALLNAAGIDASLHGTALVAIDKLDKIGRAGVREDMMARGVALESAETCLAAFEDPDALERLVASDDRGVAARRNIAEIMALADVTAARGHVTFTPRLARGLSYYTGAIMEAAVPDLAGSLGGGGRYDGLIGMFSGESIPACGFSLGLERILVVMGERKMFPADLATSAADVMVTLFEGEPVAEALRLAADLRAAGLRVDIYPEPDKLGKQFKYAASRGVAYVTIAGGDERTRGEVTLKNMITGEQSAVSRATVAQQLRTALNPEPRTPNPEP